MELICNINIYVSGFDSSKRPNGREVARQEIKKKLTLGDHIHPQQEQFYVRYVPILSQVTLRLEQAKKFSQNCIEC